MWNGCSPSAKTNRDDQERCLTDLADPVVRVIVCDDSVVVRAALARVLQVDPAIRIVGRAANGYQAIEAARRCRTDIVVLDIEMPVMDGLSALPVLLRENPAVRVIVASTMTRRGAAVTLRALQLGAADYVTKPTALSGLGDDTFGRDLRDKIRALVPLRPVPGQGRRDVPLRPAPAERPELVAIGSSTGGPQALFTMAEALGREAPVPVPVVVTQHMPADFTPLLAGHIARTSDVPCTEAIDGELLAGGRIYLAPGDRHLLLDAAGGSVRARVVAGPLINHCRPAVDPMLESAAAACGGRVLVVMLTGMGQDGLSGTRKVVEAGGVAIAQDEASSVVWGMPGAIAQAGLCHAVLPLEQIAPKVLELLAVHSQ
jgi:two-component system chemotaxis response regulator CheB